MEAHGNNSSVVSELLKGSDNYEEWSIQAKAWLLARDLWDVVAKRSRRPRGDEKLKVKAWRRKNAAALHAILISCSPDALQVIKGVTSAKIAWATLADNYGHKSVPRIERQSRLQVTTQIEKSPIQVEEESNSSESESESNPGRDDEKQIINQNDGEHFRLYDPFFKAVHRGDWSTAQTFLNQHPDAVRARIPYSGKTALHVAVWGGHLHIVERLVELMTEPDLKMQGKDGFTALAAAIESGNMAIAQCLIRKNKKLLSIIHKARGLPVRHAAVCGQRQMVPYLYSVSPMQDLILVDGGRPCASLLTRCINAKHFDIALHLLELSPVLAITDDVPGRSPVYALAFAKVFPRERSLRFWQRWIYDRLRVPDCATNHISLDIHPEANQSDEKDVTVNSSGLFLRYKEALLGLLQWLSSNLLKILGIKNIYEMKLIHVQYLEILSRMCKVIESTLDETRIKRAGVHDALKQAVYEGNVEFITSIAKANPELVWNPIIARTIFALAVQLRQAEIFSLIYGLHDKESIASDCDVNRNNMLHKAASVAPPRLLNLIPGAALQMQRELQWYKEVESIVSPAARDSTNKEFIKPGALFTKNHKDLVIAGEKWMKDTSSSCTVVGALIVTITFAAAFTFPGGNHQDTGFPMFGNNKLFKIFMISNAIALFTSTTSVLMFLGILTSRYGEEDFLKSLPKKLIIGLSTLFLSIAAMIIAFCAGLSLIFHEELWIIIPSVCFASIPVTLFVWMQFPLLIDIFMSTYGPSIIKRNVQPWI